MVVIAGATATGKTTLGIALARRLAGAEILSADSRQVYRGMDIGTAKPTPAERMAAPHHGLDLVAPDESFTAADYQRTASGILRGIAARDGIALLVGGTGLYLRAVARGLVLDEGSSDPALRAELEARLEREGLGVLVAELREADAVAAGSLDLRNPRRVIRALERLRLTGSVRPPAPAGYPAPSIWLGLSMEPEAHRRSIEERVVAHFEGGLLDEAAHLRASYREDLPAFSAMGYREAFDLLAGRTDRVSAMARDAARTWAYARRQRTWFRGEPDVNWIAAGEGATEAALAVLRPFLERLGRAAYAGC